jgi:hypothetical protein
MAYARRSRESGRRYPFQQTRRRRFRRRRIPPSYTEKTALACGRASLLHPRPSVAPIIPMRLRAPRNIGMCLGHRLIVRRAKLGLIGRSLAQSQLIRFHRLVEGRTPLGLGIGKYAVRLLSNVGGRHVVPYHLTRRRRRQPIGIHPTSQSLGRTPGRATIGRIHISDTQLAVCGAVRIREEVKGNPDLRGASRYCPGQESPISGWMLGKKFEFQERIYNDHCPAPFYPTLHGWSWHHQLYPGLGAVHCYGINIAHWRVLSAVSVYANNLGHL